MKKNFAIILILLNFFSCSRCETIDEVTQSIPARTMRRAALAEPYIPLTPSENLDPLMIKKTPLPVVWPYHDIEITSPYGFRKHPVVGSVLYHRGVDIMHRLGTPVRAAASGVVWRAAYNSVMGNHVIIKHIGGMMTIYAHLSDILVATGDEVSEGTLVGLTGSTGRSTGPHLHLGVIAGGHTVNPLYILGRTWLKEDLRKDRVPWVFGWEGEVRFF